jgi:hypothetical protein
MKIGDIVLVNDDCYLKEFFTGPCEIIEIKVTYRLTRYQIRTTYLINGKPNLTILTETEMKNISEIRNNKLKELGI